MNKRFMAAMVVLCTAFSIAACSPSSEEKPVLVFSAIPDQDEARLMTRFNKVANYLSDALEIEVRYVPVKSYSASVTAFRNNEIQLAWFGGLSGVQATQLVPGSYAIAQGVEDPQYVSYFIAHADTGLQPSEGFPEGIEGRSFTFGSKSSTSGRLMPEFFLREQYGKSPEEIFSRVGFSGDHSATIALVQSGAYEVGALSYQVWDRELAEGKVDPDKVRVIWTTPPYPDYHWVIRGDVEQKFGEGFADKVRQALLDLDDRDVLDSFPREKFIPASNEDFLPILETARSLGLMD
ncbi:putative selenate ABC transporter substrate-binding protein [Alcanivorax sp. 1008]|uniref:putative selenate ABC transporter substrate-binding protein n=1 Tax=Alcanivorax sp. 1008 TaxID=2816853 RepID=UPI001D3CA301|nr:putative selenate ABC transporter substrate-binding protein [Alcanivorax sp. 1008]MCC1495388.1 putative selenate ABC transporter substrate-binding protein [Alcanivorax sp. 1008]